MAEHPSRGAIPDEKQRPAFGLSCSQPCGRSDQRESDAEFDGLPKREVPPCLLFARRGLLDFPSGLVVDDAGLVAVDGVVQSRHRVGNLSGDALIFSRAALEVVVLIVESGEDVVAIFVGFDAAAVEV
jgi:hypothetical protein